MKKYLLHFANVMFIISIISSCEKNGECDDNKEFCASIQAENFEKAGSIVNENIVDFDKRLTDEDKLGRLEAWLQCKSCVTSAKTLCNSCIKTNPAQSEVEIFFNINGQQTKKILDIIMDTDLRCSGFHD